MVFENLSENYFDKEYYEKYMYDESGIDKNELIKSELASVIFNDFFNKLSDDESALLDLFAMVKAYNDGGV